MPEITNFGTSSRADGLEETGFDSFHRRESGLFPAPLDASAMGDLAVGAEKVEYVNVSSLLAGEIAVNQNIRGGQTAYDTGNGFWLGLDGTTAKFSIGNSSGNKITWNGSVLSITGSITATSGTIGGFDIGADYIRDVANSMGLASTVTGGDDVRFWAGSTFAARATAPFSVTEAGAVTAQAFTATTPSTVTVTGSVASSALFTAGQAIDSGNNVAVSSSDGKVYRTRATDLSSQGAVVAEGLTTSAASPAATTPRNVRFLNVSSTVKLAVFLESSGNRVTVVRAVLDPALSTITSVTETNIATSSGGQSLDATLLSSTAALITYNDGSNVYGMVLSGLDSGVTTNTEKNIAPASTNSCAVAGVSSTEAIAFYYVAATEVRAMKLTISGTTISTSTTSTVFASATDQTINSAIQFGTSGAYFVCFSESTTVFRGMVGTYSSGTLTMGSAVTIETYNAVGTSLASSDSTHVLLAYQKTNNAAGSVRCMSRSGTTLAAGAAFTTTPTCVGNKDFSITALGAYSFAAGYVSNSSSNLEMVLLELVGTSVSQLGSTFTFSAHSNEVTAMPVYHSPTRLCVCELYGSNADFSTVLLSTNHSTWVGIANASVSLNASGYFVTHGTSPTVSSTLATGSVYYTDIDGGYTTLTSGNRIGVAFSTTKLITRS